MQKGFGLIYIIMGLLVLGLVAGSAYFFGKSSSTPQPLSPPPTSTLPIKVDKNAPTDQTANWKTYTDIKSHYSINLPPQLNQVNGNQDPYYESSYFQTDDFNATTPNGGAPVLKGADKGLKLDIIVGENPNFHSYEEYKDFTENHAAEKLDFTSQKEISVGGVKAILKTGASTYKKGLFALCYFYSNGKIYQLMFTSADNQDALFETILSTFKFTN